MKHLLLLLMLGALAPITAQAAAGISPNGACETFETGEVPADYRPIESCDQVERTDRPTVGDTLRDRLMARFARLRAAKAQESNETTPSAKYIRFGRSSELRQNRFGASNSVAEESDLERRTNRVRNYQSAFRTYNHKVGTLEDKETNADRAEYQNAGGYRSIRNTTQANDPVSATPRWTPSTQNHFRERNYGTNPYSLSSLRSAQQRITRAQQAANQRVDVKGRILSNSRRWRPGRIIGDLGGDADWAVEQRELKLQNAENSE